MQVPGMQPPIPGTMFKDHGVFDDRSRYDKPLLLPEIPCASNGPSSTKDLFFAEVNQFSTSITSTSFEHIEAHESGPDDLKSQTPKWFHELKVTSVPGT